MITYQFRLYPTKKQQTEFFRQLEVHKSLYNKCLELKQAAYAIDKTNLSCFDQIKSEVPKFKGLTNYSAMQQTVRRLHKSYSSFFRNTTDNGVPRFKKRFRTIEYSKIGDGCKVKVSSVYLQGIGDVRCKFTREFPKPKTLAVTFKDGNLYINIICDNPHAFRNNKSSFVGIDFGIKSTISLSDGTSVQSPNFGKLKAKDIARLQRKKEREPDKARTISKAIAKCYTKTNNRRKDYNHKLSRSIVNRYDVICCEDFKPSEITCKINNINKRIYDIAVGQLISQLKYKAENAGKIVVMVNPAYTTQECSQCGAIQKLKLSERVYNCQCGLTLDRDQNASRNILRLGLQSLGIQPVEALKFI